MRSVGVATLVLLAGLGGCLGPADDTPAPSPTPDPETPFSLHVGTMRECVRFQGTACFEPFVSTDAAGRIYVVSGPGDKLVMSEDGGRTFANLTPPPKPAGAPANAAFGDAVVQADAKDRLYYHALVLDNSQRGQFAAGIHIARSDDQGRTWASNVLLDAEEQVPASAGFPDRQWMAFGQGDTAYLAVWQVGVGSWLSVSRDAGATWGRYQKILTVAERGGAVLPHGPLQVDGQGRLYLPYFAGAQPAPLFPSATEVRLAVSTDGGASFSQRTVHRVPSGTLSGSYWPDLVIGPTGGFAIAWKTDASGVFVSTSADGVSWSAPQRTNAERELVAFAPKVLANGSHVSVAWYAQDARDGPARYVVASAPLGDPKAEPARHVVRGNITFPGRPTDFATAAVLPDGRVVACWIDTRDGVFVAVDDI